MNHNNKNITYLSFLFFVLFFSCKTEKAAEPKQAAETPAIAETQKSSLVVNLTDAQFKNAGIKFETPSEKELPVELRLNGKVFTPASKKISVHSPLGAYVRSLPWIQGMNVKKGQLLVVLEDLAILQLEQDFLQAQNNLELAELEWKRQQALLATKATSDKLYQEAKHVFEKGKIEVMALKQKLKMIHLDPSAIHADNLSANLRLYAPENGYIQAVKSNVGDYINPQDEILTLLASGETMVVLNAFEKDIPGLAVGQIVNIETTGDVTAQYKARVTQLGKVVGAQGSVEVVCKLERASNLIEGQFVAGHITLASRKSLCIPEKSLVRYEGKEYVFIKEGERQFAMTEIVPGNRNGDWVQLQNANNWQGKEIVTDGSYTLLMTLKNVAE
jgi:cobalt-zinc-cadmium efflux system membrane fusion protein